MIKYYMRVIKWLYRHRSEKNCRQKWRRMERDMSEIAEMEKK